MQIPFRRGPSAAFLFALFCFLLPFVTLSCPAGQIKLSGLQLATGTTIQMSPEVEAQKMPAEPVATAALLCAVAGLACGLFAGRPARIAAGLAGSLGILFLLLLKTRLTSQASEQGGGMFQVSLDIGYWLALLAMAGAAVLTAMASRRSPSMSTSPDEAVARSTAGAVPTPEETI